LLAIFIEMRSDILALIELSISYPVNCSVNAIATWQLYYIIIDLYYRFYLLFYCLYNFRLKFDYFKIESNAYNFFNNL